MTGFLLAVGDVARFRTEPPFPVVNQSFPETKSDVLKPMISQSQAWRVCQFRHPGITNSFKLAQNLVQFANGAGDSNQSKFGLTRLTLVPVPKGSAVSAKGKSCQVASRLRFLIAYGHCSPSSRELPGLASKLRSGYGRLVTHQFEVENVTLARLA
jgi:hypothetical protein